MSDHAHSNSPASNGEHEAHSHHGPGISQYIYVFIALCLLTTASFLTYSDWWRSHFPPKIGWAFMMAVSCTKAMLVILFFMHVKYEAGWKYVLTVPAAFMSMLLVLLLVPDIGMRTNWFSDDRWRLVGEPRTEGSDLLHQAESEGHSPGGSPKGH